MSSFGSSDARQDVRIADWLMAILRFAITRDDIDRSAALTVARELDRPRPDADAVAFAFFSKTSAELCSAIAADHDPQRAALLRRQFDRIGNPRLRAALEAVVGLAERDTAAPRKSRTGTRAYLWKGL